MDVILLTNIHVCHVIKLTVIHLVDGVIVLSA